MMSHLPILFLCMGAALAFLDNPGDKVTLTASLTKFSSTYTPLKLTCTFEHSQDPGVGLKLLQLKLLKRPKNGHDFVNVATVSRTQLKKYDDFPKIEATGYVLNNGTDSVLEVVFKTPFQKDEGEYKCQSSSLDGDDNLVSDESSVAVTYDLLEKVVKCMSYKKREYSTDLADMKEYLFKCGADEDNWFQLLRDVMEREIVGKGVGKVNGISDIFESGSTKKSFYIFTYPNIGFSDRNCVRYQGYFAEINSKAEFNFIKKALEDLKKRVEVRSKYLLTGAYYTSIFTKFRFATDPLAPMYLGNWDYGEPERKSMKENWLLLTYDKNRLLMLDGQRQNWDTAYLCEVHNVIYT